MNVTFVNKNETTHEHEDVAHTRYRGNDPDGHAVDDTIQEVAQ